MQTAGEFHHEMGEIIYHLCRLTWLFQCLFASSPAKSSEPPRTIPSVVVLHELVSFDHFVDDILTTYPKS